MKLWSMLAAGCIVCAAPALACEYPSQLVDIPADGAAATEEEMLAAQKAVKQYIAEMEAYIDCLETAEARAGEEMTDRERYITLQRHNAAVEAMEIVADRFNTTVRAYREAHAEGG